MKCARCDEAAEGVVRIQVRTPNGVAELLIGMPLCREHCDSDQILDELWSQIESRVWDAIRGTAVADLVPVSYGPPAMHVGGTLPQ